MGSDNPLSDESGYASQQSRQFPSARFSIFVAAFHFCSRFREKAGKACWEGYATPGREMGSENPLSDESGNAPRAEKWAFQVWFHLSVAAIDFGSRFREKAGMPCWDGYATQGRGIGSDNPLS